MPLPPALARRTVRVPEPARPAVLVVRRWAVERDGAIDAAILRAVGHDARERPDGWAVVWLRHHVEFTDRPVAARDVVEIGVTADDIAGDDDAEQLAFLLMGQLAAVGPEADRGPVADLRDGTWTAVVARWGAWTAGPGLGAVRADLEPWRGIPAPHVLPASAPAPARCPACLADASPLPLLGPGMPAPDGADALAVSLGEAEHLGCEVGVPHAIARCGACGAGFVPGDADAAEAIDGLTGSIPAPSRVPGTRAVWTVPDTGGVVWCPASALLGDHWWFALSVATRVRLDAAAGAWVALRPRGGAVVYAPWSAVASAVAADAGRLHIRVTADRPALLRLPGGVALQGVTDPGRFAQ